MSRSGEWLPCDGRLVLVDKYPELFEALGTAFGAGVHGFRLPDYSNDSGTKFVILVRDLRLGAMIMHAGSVLEMV